MAGGQQNSKLGLTLNLDFTRQNQTNLNNIFNEGDVSMMDEMNKLYILFTNR